MFQIICNLSNKIYYNYIDKYNYNEIIQNTHFYLYHCYYIDNDGGIKHHESCSRNEEHEGTSI